VKRGGGDRLGWRARSSRPDQDFAIFIDGYPLGIDEFHLEIFEGVIIEIELPFERAVGDATATLEHCPRMIENLLRSCRPSTRRRFNAIKGVARTLSAPAPMLVAASKAFSSGPRTSRDCSCTSKSRATASSTLILNLRRIVALALQHQLPAIFWMQQFAHAGGLMAYGPSQRELLQRVAALEGMILKGAKPADLPVEQPMKFELVINLKTAQALGLTIPPTLLFQADEVIR
jgi:ABC transporter substrate binding protein